MTRSGSDHLPFGEGGAAGHYKRGGGLHRPLVSCGRRVSSFAAMGVGEASAFVPAPRSASVAIIAALVLAAAGSGYGGRPNPAARSRTLVTYIEEQGGIVFRYTSLIVSTSRLLVRVRHETCVRGFPLRPTL
jgi:hypothetical protein